MLLQRMALLRLLLLLAPGVRLGLLLAAYLLYLLMGAAVFSALEGPPERALWDSLQRDRLALLDDFQACLSEERLAKLLEKVLEAGSYGISGLGNLSGSETWDFSSSLFFTASVLTTTGYGHTVPLSPWGKIFCILYSLVGIPLTLLFLAILLHHLLPIVSERPVQYLHTRLGLPLAHVALAHAMALALVTLGLFILIPAICFWALEGDWTFLESVYFCFISLSTIGLGDYVPEGSLESPLHELYEISITCYLLVGLLAMLVALETAHRLQEIRAVVRYFAPVSGSSPPEDDDRLEIMSRDQLALTEASGSAFQNGPVEPAAT